MNFDRLDLHDQILQQTNSFKLLIDERNGKLTLELIAEKHVVFADCFHISNMLNNLFDNACKYSPMPPEITIKTYNKNGWIKIAISDKGLGIEKTDQKVIFQEFSRVNTGNVHNIKGFGLGLSYVWQIVELHKGKLHLESKLGEGSTFFIELPFIE
jgi:two-component system phosphate regulon sensor histidine kinase PhoR